jgi:hypothetical protein
VVLLLIFSLAEENVEFLSLYCLVSFYCNTAFTHTHSYMIRYQLKNDDEKSNSTTVHGRGLLVETNYRRLYYYFEVSTIY